MKNIFRNTAIAFCSTLLMAFAACSSDNVTNTTIIPSQITAAQIEIFPVDSITIDMTTPTATAAEFVWSDANFSYPAAVQYTLMGTVGDLSTQLGSIYATSLALSQQELNTELIGRLGGTAGVAMEVEVTLQSSIGVEKYDVVSLPVSIVVTPYAADPVPLWVVGAYNNWTPTSAVALYSETGDGVYTGWVYMDVSGTAVDTDVEFLLLPEQNWDNKYASTAGGFSALVYNGSSNLTLPNGYLYNLQADTNTLMGEVLSKYTTIGVIGDATPGGWDTDTDLTYDSSTMTFTATVALTSGGYLKFRADDDWAVNWGVGLMDGELSLGGDNILFSGTSGTYTITFNPFAYTPTYTITAQ